MIIDYPANTLCRNIDQGKQCPDYDKPEGCPYMHLGDGMENARQENTLQKDLKISLGRTPVFTLQWRPVIGFRGSIAVQQQLHCLHSKWILMKLPPLALS